MSFIDEVTGKGRYRDLKIHPDDFREENLEQISKAVAESVQEFSRSVLLDEPSPTLIGYTSRRH